VQNLSSAIILKALDCLSVRAQASAENIANANTPGYRPLRVTFEKALAAAAAEGKTAVEALQPGIVTDPAIKAGDMRLDLEVTTASATGLRYAALIELLNRQHQRDDLALAGNT
jgi:flagellar basal-body rod protein FlgB